MITHSWHDSTNFESHYFGHISFFFAGVLVATGDDEAYE